MLKQMRVTAPRGVRLPDGTVARMTPVQAAVRRCVPEEGQPGTFRLAAPSEFKCGEVLGLDPGMVPKAALAAVEEPAVEDSRAREVGRDDGPSPPAAKTTSRSRPRKAAEE
jgi:hypothetical protein